VTIFLKSLVTLPQRAAPYDPVRPPAEGRGAPQRLDSGVFSHIEQMRFGALKESLFARRQEKSTRPGAPRFGIAVMQASMTFTRLSAASSATFFVVAGRIVLCKQHEGARRGAFQYAVVAEHALEHVLNRCARPRR